MAKAMELQNRLKLIQDRIAFGVCIFRAHAITLFSWFDSRISVGRHQSILRGELARQYGLPLTFGRRKAGCGRTSVTR